MNRVPISCTTCTTSGRQGTCARHRCYCGHPECWAYDSWQPIRQAPANAGAHDFKEQR
ncbi:hypothetical protein ArV2_gp63 [Arthrobacter phage vB_ArS-ArV2]|uniref:Uncharacterized protein n=1 Tax=Arthrobacter phage vB_ArS-ArV2 TaxID=1414742 RepID=V5RBG2_9CAUD|nr:hypothetical protein ArV2_gp63 [Arthrobacter phage vB_ArS-ArV2]AHB31674.1 hypothetical protein ArV2_gp63 [Arthrobacter phage vB_ArS-ArV2]